MLSWLKYLILAVFVIAIPLAYSVQEFLDSEGYTVPFARDEDGSIISSLGGSTMLPMTVVLDSMV